MKRVLLKISGEALSGGGHGIDPAALEGLCRELVEASRLGSQIALVVGGGNFVRGAQLADDVLARHTADYMGMLATVMNGLTLSSALRSHGAAATLLSALEVRHMVTPYSVDRCRHELELGRIVVLAGGTGNPYFTTDTCASLRAVEISADVLLKGTKVDGVYSGDPNTDSSATRYDRVSYREVLDKRLGVMDATAIALCREHGMPIRVFNMMEPGNIKKALLMEETGTLVSADEE